MLWTYFFMCAIWTHRKKSISLKLEFAVHMSIFQGHTSISLYNFHGILVAIRQKSSWNFICVLWVLVFESSM